MRPAVLPFILLSLLCCALSSPATAAGTVTGRVIDPDGRPVRGAEVLLVEGAAVVARAVTDAEGAFRLAAPHEGPFDLHAAADGLRARPLAVRGSDDAGEVRLNVSALRESVVVSAAQVDVPLSTTSSSVTVLTGEELAALQVHDLAEALRLVPGLAMATAGSLGAQTSAFPRGGESDYSLVLVDGVQANAFGGGFDFAHLPVAHVDRVEIVRGPQSALYGSNAIGAVVRVVTRRGGPPSAAAFVEGGSFGTSRVAGTASGAAGGWQWGGALDRLASDGLVRNDDYERWTVGGGGGWTGAAGAAARADVHYTSDDRGTPGPYGADPGGTFGGLDTISRGRNERWLASVSGAVPAGPRVRVHSQIAHARIDGEQLSAFDPANPSTITSRRTLGRLQADVTLHRDLAATLGGELQRERAGSTFITAGPAEVPIERTLGGLFAEARWHRAGRLFVTAGVRAERIARDALAADPNPFSPRPAFDGDVVTSVNPKIGVSWFARSEGGSFTKLRAAAGSGIRPPDAFEIAFTDNPSLAPERSRSVEAGIDQAFAGGRATLEATVFDNRYDDLIVAVGSFSRSSRYRTDNISNARARGLELVGGARVRLPLRVPVDLRLRAGVTFLDTGILAVDGGDSAPPPFAPGDRLLRRPARQFSSEVAVKAGSLSAFLTAGGRSRTLDVDPSFGAFGGLFEAAGFAVAHAGAGWDLGRGVGVFGRVTNLFDRDYEEALGFPAPGRAAVVGVRVAAGR